MKLCTSRTTKNILAERVYIYISRIYTLSDQRKRERERREKLHAAVDMRANGNWIVAFANLGDEISSLRLNTNLYGEVFETLTKIPACLGGTRGLFENALCAETALMAWQ
jgi:hypothetical protein